MKRILILITFLIPLCIAAQDYHDAAVYSAHGNLKEIKTNAPGLPSMLSKAKFNEEGKQVVSIFKVNMTEYNEAGYPIRLFDENFPISITYSFDNQNRPVNIKWNCPKDQSISMSYTYSDATSEFPDAGELTVKAEKKGEITESTINFQYSNYTRDDRGNWVTRKVVSTDSAHPEYIEARKLKYYK